VRNRLAVPLAKLVSALCALLLVAVVHLHDVIGDGVLANQVGQCGRLDESECEPVHLFMKTVKVQVLVQHQVHVARARSCVHQGQDQLAETARVLDLLDRLVFPFAFGTLVLVHQFTGAHELLQVVLGHHREPGGATEALLIWLLILGSPVNQCLLESAGNWVAGVCPDWASGAFTNLGAVTELVFAAYCHERLTGATHLFLDRGALALGAEVDESVADLVIGARGQGGNGAFGLEYTVDLCEDLESG